MRSTLRSLTFGLAATLAGALSAQLPYTLVIQGTISGCVPFQQVTVETLGGADPMYEYTLEVFPNSCFFDTIMEFNGPSVWISVSTQCNGTVLASYDSVLFNNIGDTAVLVMNIGCNGGGTPDCNGILNGPDVPGAPCNDGDPMTISDVWSPTCICAGTLPQNCEAAFSIQQGTPWNMLITNESSGGAPISYAWTLPDGSTSTQFEPGYTFTSTGVYEVCLTISAGGGCMSTACDSIFVDSLGNVISGFAWYDCLGVNYGANMPGTACDDGDPSTINDTWMPGCTCTGYSGAVDCLGIPGGTYLPGTPCTYSTGGWSASGYLNNSCDCILTSWMDCNNVMNGPELPGTACDDGDPATLFSWWSPACVCTADSGGTLYDCLQIPNGPNLPGTPCVVPGTTIEGTWSMACVCTPDSSAPCQADFWVLQAYGQDSLPVPYELWVWNLSSGGSGIYSFSWDFGDGTTSTDPYPTHTYAGNGPYALCLTLNDLNGCTSIHCDSISIDGDGMYSGVTGGDGARQDGFTINVQNPAANSVQEPGLDDVVLWPNPVADELNVAVNGMMRGTARFMVIDMNGRVVLDERHALNGRTQLRLATDALAPGMYTLLVSDGQRNLTDVRFVRTH